MASRKVLAVSALIVALTALPAAAAGTHEVDFWSGLWQRVVALLMGEVTDAGLADPAETTMDDPEYAPHPPIGG